MKPDDYGGISREYSQYGVVRLDQLVSPGWAEQLASALTDNALGGSTRPGMRNLIAHDEVIKLAERAALVNIARTCLTAAARPIKATLFDKSDDANWLVAWHQDPAIPVSSRIDLPGWSGWSTKDGVHHVHPPTEILERVVAIRVHLDEVTVHNGPLKVLPGTHLQGRIRSDAAAAIAKKATPVVCMGERGSAVVMSPLALHASSKSSSAERRRVLHIEYSDAILPQGLAWPSQDHC